MKLNIKVFCTHEDKNVECDFIEEGEIGGYWFKCPKCKREVGLMLKVEDK